MKFMDKDVSIHTAHSKKLATKNFINFAKKVPYVARQKKKKKKKEEKKRGNKKMGEKRRESYLQNVIL